MYLYLFLADRVLRKSLGFHFHRLTFLITKMWKLQIFTKMFQDVFWPLKTLVNSEAILYSYEVDISKEIVMIIEKHGYLWLML